MAGFRVAAPSLRVAALPVAILFLGQDPSARAVVLQAHHSPSVRSGTDVDSGLDGEGDAGDIPHGGVRARPWNEAEELARTIASNMSVDEMVLLMRGAHSYEAGWYVGNTQLVERVGVPSLKMHDAGAGFRTLPGRFGDLGTTTSWPSLLAFASTWDIIMMEEVGAAMGREFRTKGANVMLGPSINVHRATNGGRNFEYLSGEDPYLGKTMAMPFIVGVQKEGVMACVKHFAFNEQEYHRMDSDSVVDEATAWELYYPPFEAAVSAGAASFMCAYNKVNGKYACENPELLQRDLKEKMGFKGFVVSDWDAIHSTEAIGKGLDMDMPGDDSFSVANISNASLVSEVERFDAVVNILTSIYRLRIDETPGCKPPACYFDLQLETPTPQTRAHTQKAIKKMVTLLKNDGVLPLNPLKVQRLAVLGSAANALPSGGMGFEKDYYSGGGSGHVSAKWVKTPLDGIVERAHMVDMQVHHAANDNFDRVKDLVYLCDTVVIVAATSSTEGTDRATLSLDNNVDALISQVAQVRPTIVLMQTPGAVLTPWRDNVSAILNLFLAGEATGYAWAPIIFGDYNPHAKLPIMFPATASDAIMSSPTDTVVPYNERLQTSYRSHHLKAAFPFGHGLSYTQFLYKDQGIPSCPDRACCYSVTVQNVGQRPGREVAQAYLQLHPEAESRPVLRGFAMTRSLKILENEAVEFQFTKRDISTFKAGHGWTPVAGPIPIYIGSSSADIRISDTITCA